MKYVLHLSRDDKLKPLIKAHGPFKLRKRDNVPLRICASIMSQQLSTRVADVIYERFLNLFDGKEPQPDEILRVNHETLRGIGLSNNKVTYVHNVARFAIEQGMEHRKLSGMDDEELIEYLTQIKGVGRWTAEMILMFSLGREDIFSADDLGIQKAMMHLYKIRQHDKKKLKNRMIRIAESWVPYRTYACMHLWRFKDGGTI
jgi:DNA-3-methyladenine glycosylase II